MISDERLGRLVKLSSAWIFLFILLCIALVASSFVIACLIIWIAGFPYYESQLWIWLVSSWILGSVFVCLALYFSKGVNNG